MQRKWIFTALVCGKPCSFKIISKSTVKKQRKTRRPIRVTVGAFRCNAAAVEFVHIQRLAFFGVVFGGEEGLVGLCGNFGPGS